VASMSRQSRNEGGSFLWGGTSDQAMIRAGLRKGKTDLNGKSVEDLLGED